MFFQLGQWEVNAATLSVVAHVAKDVGELEGLAKVNGILLAGLFAIPENFNTQQAHD